MHFAKITSNTSVETMLDSFLTFINLQKWDLENKKTLLAVSGGIDSVVLLQLFHTAGLDVGIAHCNFGLRGEDSDGDAQFVKDLGEKYGVAVHTKRFDTKTFAQRQSVSTQMAARDLRYAWFEEIRSQHGYDWIATAHHANDSIETMLLNLTRGTGLTGLHGVPVENGRIIRPLLFAPREEIWKYLVEQKLVWREDRTNASVEYKRNRIRHEVIPVLKDINPSLESTFQSTAERLRAADVLLQTFLEKSTQDLISSSVDYFEIAIDQLMDSAEPGYRLWFILKNYGFTYLQAGQIVGASYGSSGKIFESPTHEVLKDRGHFVVKAKTGQQTDVELLISDESKTYFLHPGSFLKVENLERTDELDLKSDPNILLVDKDLMTFPLVLRNWKVGESIRPFGMGGKRKKISDLLIDAKRNLYQKQGVQVIVNGRGEVIWIIGLRTDHLFKISDKTINVLKITLSHLTS
jgi:tRNA(Ile)-lysidine synthase